jgi:hypothetical protein
MELSVSMLMVQKILVSLVETDLMIKSGLSQYKTVVKSWSVEDLPHITEQQ